MKGSKKSQPKPADSETEGRRLEDRVEFFESIIAPKSVLTGDITGEDGVRVSGTMNGSIDSRGLVRIDEEGSVTGNIKCPYVIVEGELSGDIQAAEHVELRSQAKMQGNIQTALIAIADGCVFEGQVAMEKSGREPIRFEEKRTLLKEDLADTE